MKLAVDAMGGDHAPKEIVLGVKRALDEFEWISKSYNGNETQIKV